MVRKWGWKPDKTDHRDLQIFSKGRPKTIILPDEIDKRTSPFYPPVYDQLETSSCTGNAGGRIFHYGLKQAGLATWQPSRLFLYGNARKEEGSYGSDSGAEIRDIMKGANKVGIIPEPHWEFKKSNITKAIPKELITEAEALRIHFYAYVDSTIIDSIRMCLFHDYLIAIGSDIYDPVMDESFEKDPVMRLPTAGQYRVGGHAWTIVGCDHPNRRFLWANSWGPLWVPSMGGHAWVDYDFVVSSHTGDGWMNRFK